jgi:hypothetical protein
MVVSFDLMGWEEEGREGMKVEIEDAHDHGLVD